MSWEEMLCASTECEAHMPEKPIWPSKIGHGPQHSRSLESGVRILSCFSGQRPTWQISELADELGMGSSTTHRYAKTLVALGYLEQDAQRRYRLARLAGGPGITVIGTIRLEAPAARTVLESLREATGHTASLAALDGTHAIYLQRLFAHGPGQFEADLQLDVGARVPIHCTAIGKALLASLTKPEQRAAIASLTLEREGPNSIKTKRALAEQLAHFPSEGLTICDEEQGLGVRSIAAPIPHPSRSRPLAVSVTVPARLYTVQAMIETLGPQVKAAARRI
ncbi:MAG TPA: IclR family transcriptional regulator [Solirubrobacteraceae bacterium]|jgi:IclR family pca regulon transcriptional regulator|nr:IclR family transcriptional regulator [Solirubrobacteraceae bacterium]